MNASIQRWLTTLVICAVAGVAALSVYGMWQVNRIYLHATQGAIKTVPGVVDLMETRLHAARVRQSLYQHVAVADIAEKAALDTLIKHESEQAVEALRHYALFMTHDDDDAQMLSVEHRMQEEYLRSIPGIIHASYAGDMAHAKTLLQEQGELAGMLDGALGSHLRHHFAHGGESNGLAQLTFEEASHQTVLFVLVMVTAILMLGHVIAKRIRLQVDHIQALARDNAMFRSMVDCVADRAVFVIDPSNLSHIVYANAAASRHFGIDLETLKTWRAQDIDPHFELYLAESSDAHGFCQFESEHRIAGGELIPVEITLNAFEHEGQAFSVCMVLDLRPQREAEAYMRALERLDAEQVSARQLTRFAQSAPGVMFTLEQTSDGEFRMLYASPAVEEILGLSVLDVLIDVGNIRDRILPPDLDDLMQHMAESARTMSPIHATFRIRRAQGLRWLEANATPSAMDDGAMQWHGFITDVTERKQIDEQLALQQRELSTLVENTPDVIIRYDRDCRRTWISPNYAQVYGRPVEEALGTKPTEVWGRPRMHPSVYESLLQQVMAEGMARDIELDWYDEAGEYVCQSLRVVPEYGADGEVVSALSLTRDVSEIKQAGMMLADHQAEMVRLFQELSTHEQHQRALLDNFPFFVWLKDTESRLLAANSAYARVAGVADTRELEGKTDFDFFPHDLAQAYVEDDRAVMSSGQTRNVVEAYQNDDGERRWMETWKSAMYVDGQLSGTVGFSRDVTDHVQREQELRSLVENTPDTIARYDRHCRRVFANSQMQLDCHATQEQLLGTTPAEFPGWDYSGQYEQVLREVIATGKPGSFEISMRRDDGQPLCRHIRLAPEFGADGEVASVLAVGRDISEIDAYRKQIHSLAFFDPLTDLPNRSSLNQRIRQIVADDTWHGQFGLMVMDLDRFKEVNDMLGHGVGDALLREAASRLLECVRTYDMVARLGGDEFAILLPEIGGSTDINAIARKMLEAFHQPFMLEGRELFISTSIGIAQYPGDTQDVDALFRYADSAMYHAKKQHGNNFKFYSAEMTTSLAGRVQIESALRKAGRRHELELYYQPQVDLASGRMVGAEALLRWNRDGKGLVAPDQFIPIAEESGLIVSIGEWVLSSACEAAAAWNQGRETPLCVAINLSTRQFIHNDLVGTVSRILEKTGCAPQWVKLEITEGLLLEDAQEVSSMLEAFDRMGLAISIDDFGTGYSALSYLNRFPVSQIKIDRSFVNGIPAEHDKTELVKAMISISQALELDLVAEGVETQEQADCLLQQGCRTAQGYLFGKPMPKTDFEQLIVSGR